MSAHAQLFRLQEIVGHVTKLNCAFTRQELDQIEYDAKGVFTKDAADVIAALVDQIRKTMPT